MVDLSKLTTGLRIAPTPVALLINISGNTVYGTWLTISTPAIVPSESTINFKLSSGIKSFCVYPDPGSSTIILSIKNSFFPTYPSVG